MTSQRFQIVHAEFVALKIAVKVEIAYGLLQTFDA
jgi:hypothetical protein